MNLIRSLTCATIFLVIGYAADGATLDESASSTGDFWMQFSIIDVAQNLPFKSIANHSLVELRPDSTSGGLKSSATVDLETGKVGPLRDTRYVYSGQWRIVAASTEGNQPSQLAGVFNWGEAFKPRVPSLSNSSRIYLPFTFGGMVLCILDDSKEGRSRFEEIYLIPSGPAWQNGTESVVLSPALLEQVEAVADSGAWETVVERHNPLLTTFLLRTIADSDRHETEDKFRLYEELWRNDDPVKPVIVFFLSRSVASSPRSEVGLLDRLISEADEVSDIVALRIGLSTSERLLIENGLIGMPDVYFLRSRRAAIEDRARAIGADQPAEVPGG